jgi:hypothetical protein
MVSDNRENIRECFVAGNSASKNVFDWLEVV